LSLLKWYIKLLTYHLLKSTIFHSQDYCYTTIHS